MSGSRLAVLVGRLADERGKRVVFLSHCLLNQNVRYLGGATRPGGLPEVVSALQREGLGIVQMRGPEQRAWGGVLNAVPPRSTARTGRFSAWCASP
jgi:uncharacterized protein YbbK (DUF523 family)